MGIEPTSEAWEALNKTLKAIDLAALSFWSDSLNWKPDGNRNEYRAQIQSVPFCRYYAFSPETVFRPWRRGRRSCPSAFLPR
jgi:hypothetical protein